MTNCRASWPLVRRYGGQAHAKQLVLAAGVQDRGAYLLSLLRHRFRVFDAERTLSRDARGIEHRPRGFDARRGPAVVFLAGRLGSKARSFAENGLGSMGLAARTRILCRASRPRASRVAG
ncbi:hypothetical protein BURPS1710A_A0450 [Burkholderia pseudomallei 1710a]|uniref:Uncharacterized protein n=1 Tax=Burkholderia pseudomallei 1710a TaxID=320371 RepID=A0A0E1W2J5_BURPE|nr:hypothetical protein BURPS1710A_A0450 [Burkholderia pseudomallei 1710a]